MKKSKILEDLALNEFSEKCEIYYEKKMFISLTCISIEISDLKLKELERVIFNWGVASEENNVKKTTHQYQQKNFRHTKIRKKIFAKTE